MTVHLSETHPAEWVGHHRVGFLIQVGQYFACEIFQNVRFRVGSMLLNLSKKPSRFLSFFFGQ